jgi:hypothetical protein
MFHFGIAAFVLVVLARLFPLGRWPVAVVFVTLALTIGYINRKLREYHDPADYFDHVNFANGDCVAPTSSSIKRRRRHG